MIQKNKAKKSFVIDVYGARLNVFIAGLSPRIPGEKARSNDPTRMKTIHTHFTYEVFFVTDGSLELITEHGNTFYERKIVIIPPKIKHYTTPNSRESFCLLFSIEDAKENTLPNAFLKMLNGKEGNGIVCNAPISDDIIFYIRKISEKLEENSRTSEKEAEILISLVFHEMIRTLSPESIISFIDKDESNHINDIEAYINFKFYDKITLSDVAKHVFLSTRQVARIIKKEYGCSLSDLVIDKKLASAEILLRNTDMKISDIAHQINFGSENYLYSLFKKKYGYSPLQYRKMIKEKNG